MSLVLPPIHAQPYPLSRSSTPKMMKPLSRASTPPPLAPALLLPSLAAPISAPPTPVIPTHVISMERCRSSEAILGSSVLAETGRTRMDRSRSREGRDGRKRDVKATSLLYRGLPSSEEITAAESSEGKKEGVEHVEEVTEDEKMDVDVEEVVPAVWGMPRWGREEERKEVRKGVRLIGMEELPGLIEQHEMLDIPSHVLFPWLHGISDDGNKGREMGAFFGHNPPFQPPPYRGLCVLLAPPHPLDATTDPLTPEAQRPCTPMTPLSPDMPRPMVTIPRERSATMSTSSESYRSTTTTEATSPSVDESDVDVQMHPCESKRVSPQAKAEGLDSVHHPLPCEGPTTSEITPSTSTSSASSDSEDTRPSCILLNSLHLTDVFEIPQLARQGAIQKPRFRQARLPQQINLRNLNIQQIKYATISDLVVYAKGGVGSGVLELAEQVAVAQEELWRVRMEEYFAVQARGDGEGLGEPVRYGVWVLVEPFRKVEKAYPPLVNIDADSNNTANSALTDLFEREAAESRAMTRGSEVVEGLWVGNDCDVPGGADDGAGSRVQFDLCVKASECSDMPSAMSLSTCHRKLVDLDKKRKAVNTVQNSSTETAWAPSPATIALRNLLSSPISLPVEPPTPLSPNKRTSSPTPPERRRRPAPLQPDPSDKSYITLDVAGSCRTITGQTRNLSSMTDRVVETVYFLRKLVEGRDKTGKKRKVLIHCQDGYTESSIIVLAYLMSSLSISLPEAFVHLQIEAKRSFFLYPSDKPLLRKVDARLAADRRVKAEAMLGKVGRTRSGEGPSSGAGASSPTSPCTPGGISKWKSWGIGFGSGGGASGSKGDTVQPVATVEVAREMLVEEDKGGSEGAVRARTWFDDRRFDGFPSRILPFLYLGNLEHAGNAGMLEAIGVTHVVSVGESLITCQPGCDPMYGALGMNTLSVAYHEGRIQVLDLNDIRDDGNDPLRPLIDRACAWIEQARMEGGKILVHCRVGVSRSASIVIAYMMQHQGAGLMDAYLLTRARRLNVLIQPNLRFFHELFGWEVELARREVEEGRTERRRILYSWPSFCRDLHCLNRRFLAN